MEPNRLLCTSSHTTVRNIEDRLSNLPESLLHHILSFLDIKFVVETSLFSKSWRSLWTTLPFLNFTSECHSDIYKLKRFAKKVFSRRESSNILSFRLQTVSDSYIYFDIITFALQCKPIELHLHIQPANSFCSIWSSIFTPNTLTSMELDFFGTYLYKLSLPDEIDLPLLTSLRLRSFRRLTNTFLETIFSGCHVLENFEMIGCTLFKEGRVMKLSSHQLKHLKIDKGCFKFNRNNGYNITISTPNLISFQCRDYCSRKYFLDSLSSLVTADIYIDVDVNTVFKGEGTDAHLVMEYFEGVRNVNNLTFNSPNNFRVVLNQKSLEISFIIFKGYYRVVMHILKLHNIHTLVVEISRRKENSILEYFPLEMTEYRGEDFGVENLKHIEFRNAQGLVYELDLLKILLKCASTLERVTIFTCKKVFVGKEIKLQSLREKLLSCPRASRDAEILFC